MFYTSFKRQAIKHTLASNHIPSVFRK